MYCSLNGNREMESTTSSASGPTWPSSSGLRSSGLSSSGPSSSGLSISGPTDSAANDDSSGSEDSEGVNVVSLLSKLRSPRPSDFARKRKIAANPPCGKRRSRGKMDTDLKTIRPEKRVRDYPNEPLTVSNGKLFCRGC